MFIAAFFPAAKTWKQPKGPSMDGWVKSRWSLHAMQLDSSVTSKEILPFVTTRTDLEDGMQSAGSKTQIEKYRVISPIRGILTIKKVKQVEAKCGMVAARGWGTWGEGVQRAPTFWRPLDQHGDSSS